jgi:hypothetical protein
MNGSMTEFVASSWIEPDGALSRWIMRSVPPDFCASAGATAPAVAMMATAATVTKVFTIAFLPDFYSSGPYSGSETEKKLFFYLFTLRK